MGGFLRRRRHNEHFDQPQSKTAVNFGGFTGALRRVICYNRSTLESPLPGRAAYRPQTLFDVTAKETARCAFLPLALWLLFPN